MLRKIVLYMVIAIVLISTWLICPAPAAEKRCEVVFNDMSKCVPQSALSRVRQAKYNKWKLVDYETSVRSGVAIAVGREYAEPGKRNVPEVTLPLNVSGWYEIHLGIFDSFGPPTRRPGCSLYLKLTKNPDFQNVAFDVPTKRYLVQDGFWRHADLTGQDLIVRESTGQRGGLAWVRLVPVEKEAVERYRNEPPTKIVIAKHDELAFTNPQKVKRVLLPYQNSDFKKLFLAVDISANILRSDMVKHISEIVEEAVNAGRIMSAPTWYVDLKAQRASGRDPIDLLNGPVHEMGMELHLGLRIGGWTISPLWGYIDWECELYKNHPEWRCRDRDGTELPNMSYAFAEVRDYIVSRYREMVDKHPDALDGLNLIFTRGPIFIMYEQPLIDGFKKKTGKDPRDVDPESEDWLRYRASFLTELVRSMRKLCDELEAKYGRRLKLSANVFSSRKQNLRFGLDLETWVDEKLVDLLIPMGLPWPNTNDGFDTDFFVKLGRRPQGACKVVVQMPNLVNGRIAATAAVPQNNMARYVDGLYEAGLDGVFFWDTVTCGFANLAMMRRLGHPEQVKRWAELKTPSFLPRGSSGEYVPVIYEDDRGEGSGRPGGEYGWRTYPPTKSFLIEKLDGHVVGRYWCDTGG